MTLVLLLLIALALFVSYGALGYSECASRVKLEIASPPPFGKLLKRRLGDP